MKTSNVVYETGMAILAVLSVVSFWVNSPTWAWVDKMIWVLFVFDFITRLFLSGNKWSYIKENPLDLIAIIPFESVFRVARVARLFKVIRLLAIFKKMALFKVLKTNNLDKAILLTFVIIFLSAIPIKLVEPNINSYEDALWWAIVTATTVGYGDISPVTGIGRLVAFVLMMFGIGLIGMVTGSIATFFLVKPKVENTTISFIKNELSRYDDLSPKELDTIIYLLQRIKNEKEHEKEHEKSEKSI